ncbi:TPA: 30S ribosomal protein S13 [Candidatus Woesearchaeota archaeon]|nr:30S ribosomal protein S13 [Candidatus Woesearchaeota archaeon]HIH39125.1 30S ribosomal protein S13 [Candidatus Woesearchaeota archaeon]
MAEEQKNQKSHEQKPQQFAQPKPYVEKESANFRYIVRIANTDLDGKKQLIMALQKIKGISFMLSNAFCAIAKLDQTRRVGDLSEEEVNKLDLLLKNKKPEIPSWLFNRRKDFETGEDIHLTGADLTFSHESDIRMLKKIKCYRGVRHMQGAPVRGQRTRSNFRKNKGKVASVKRSVVAKAASEAKAKEAKKEEKGKK